MDIVLFEDVTTEDVVSGLEAESEKYVGLYVEMEDPEQRKYVKDKASLINDMLKKLDRARIDKSKQYKAKVEAEAESIRTRLEKANEPFTLLIDEYKAERKKILDAQKARELAEEQAKELERDHEMALLVNMQWDSEKEQREAARLAERERIAEEARQQFIAEQNRALELEKIEKEKRAAIAAKIEQDRINNIEHRRAVNNNALADLLACGIDEESAKMAVKAIAANKVSNVTINY